MCNAIGAHHDEVEMTSPIAPIIQSATPYRVRAPAPAGQVVESYIKRLKEMGGHASSYPGVVKTYAIQAGRELRVIVGADKLTDQSRKGWVARYRQENPGRDIPSRPGEDRHRHSRKTRAGSVREIRTPPVGQAAHGLACRKFSHKKNPSAKTEDFLSTASYR